MTQPISFDERARQLTRALLSDAEHLRVQRPGQYSTSTLLRGVAAFAVTVLLIGGAIVWSSLALHGSTVEGPSATSPADSVWTSSPIDTKGVVQSLWCPDAADCVAVDESGDVITSTNPAGGTAAWHQFAIGAVHLTAVSCPTPSLCLAVDQTADVFTSTNPPGGSGAWSRVAEHLGTRPGPNTAHPSSFNAISCADATFCIAVGGADGPDAGQVATITNPTDYESWGFTNVGFPELVGVACPSEGLCVAVGGGVVVTSTDGGNTWTVTRIDGVNTLTGISCPTVSLCVAVDAAGHVVTSTNPSGGAGAWTVTDADGSRQLTAISCASATLCVAGDSLDSVVVSTDPTGGSAAWSRTPVTTGQFVNAVSCPDNNFCVVWDTSGFEHTSTNPGH